MPVTDEEGRVIGIITEIDLLQAVMDGKDLGRQGFGKNHG